MKNLLFFAVLFSVTIMVGSCMADDSLAEDRTTTDYSGVYSDTLSIRVGSSRYIVDTVIQKTLTRINDNTYQMAYAFGDPNFPPYAPTLPVIVYIRQNNFVVAEFYSLPLINIWQSSGYVDPTRNYFRIEMQINGNAAYPTIDKMRKL